MSKKSSQKARTPIDKSPPQQKKQVVGSHASSIEKEAFFTTYWKPVSVICLLAIILYAQTLSFGYVLDDSILITGNKFTQKGVGGIPEIFSTEGFKGYYEQDELVQGGRYRPLSLASFALEKSIFGDKPGVGHFINVLLYALSGILIFRVLLLMFPRRTTDRWWFSIPFVATLLFIVHPLHTEIVANIKGRDEIFALMGELGVLYYSFRYVSERKYKYLWFSFICFFLGILSKESVITFLAVTPITLHFFTRSTRTDKFKTLVPLVAGTFIYLIMRYAALGYLYSGLEITNIMNNPFYGVSFSDKTATIFFTLLLYLKLLVYPHPLTHDYYPYHIPILNWSDWAPIASLLIHIALAIIAIKGWKKKTVLSYCILFYLFTLSIVSNLFISIGAFMNERFLYHSSLGFCIIVGWLLVEKLKNNEWARKVATGVFFIAVVAFAAKTEIRLPDWKSMAALDRAGMRVSYNSARANHFYARLMWDSVYLKLPGNAPAGQRKAVLDSMKPYFYRAIEILPSYYEANAMKAGIAAEYHKLDNNYDSLLKVFEEVNRTGVEEKFILDYLHYINQIVNNRKDALKVQEFYRRMILLFDRANNKVKLREEYRTLLNEIDSRINQLP